MKSTVDKSGTLSRQLNVEIPAEVVSAAFDAFYNDVKKNVSVKGFRKGKTPMDTIKKMYATEAEQDVARKLINENYFIALGEHKLNPINYPQFDFDKCTVGQEFKFSAKFEVRPEVKVDKVEGLEVEKEKLNVSDENINEVIQNLRENHATESPVLEDRPAKEGDIADIDFEGSIDGETFQGGTAKGHTLKLGSKSFIDGFEEGVIGMKPAQEKDIKLTFPKDYHSAEFAGKDVVFKVKLNALKQSTPAELNEEFFKMFGEVKTEEEFTEFIKKGIVDREEGRIKEEMKDRVIKALVDANPIEAPASLVSQQRTSIVNDTWSRMQQQGMTQEQFEDYKNKWGEDFDKSAVFMVKATFLIDDIAKQNELHASEEDFEKKVNEISGQMGFPVDQLKEFYGAEDKKGNLMFTITQDKVLDFLISKASIKEVERDKLTPVEK